MNKLGPHVQRLTANVLDWIQLAQPPVIVWTDPNQDGVDAIRAKSPGTFIVGRRFEGGQGWLQNWDRRVPWQAYVPRQLARRFGWWASQKAATLASRAEEFSVRPSHSLIMANWAYKRSWHLWQAAVGPEAWADQCAAMAKCDAYICWNEPFGHDSAHLFAPFDEWQVRFRNRLLTHGIEAVAFNFGTGNFTAAPDRVKVSEAFPATCASFKYFGIHEYYWPNLQGGQGWHTLRFPAWYEDINRSDVEFIITECGLTQAVHHGRPDRGWRDGVPDAPTEDEYLATLDWYNQQLCKYPYLKGAAIFNWGGHGWETFEHEDHPVRFQIAALDAEEPPPEPPPMNGGDKLKVYDMDGNLFAGAFADALVAKHGLSTVLPAGLKDGDLYFEITELREKTGDSAFIYRVLNLDGEPIVNPDETLDKSQPHRAWEWPTIKAEESDIQTLYGTDWHSRADLGGLNENGEGGSGMGPGAYHDPGEPGPHEAWVRHPTIPSTKLIGIGMLGGTNHDHMDATWRLTRFQGQEPPPPTDGHPQELHDMATRLHQLADLWPTDGATLYSIKLTFSDGTVRRIML